MNRKKFSHIGEWATWASLDNVNDIELILLKGHLIIELVLEDILFNLKIEGVNKMSFFRKTTELEKVIVESKKNKKIISALLLLNKMRNELAHEYGFKVSNSELYDWAELVLDSFEGEKWSKFTNRTKIIHAFSY